MNENRSFEIGTVKFFNIKKKFGFLVLPNSEEIFFHYNDARNLDSTGEDIHFEGYEWSGYHQTYVRQIHRYRPNHRDPKAGDKIIFWRGWSRKGDKAEPWTFESELAEIQKKLESRPLFRAYVRYTVVGNAPDKPRLEWEGKDLNDKKLTDFWNPKYDRGNFSNGDLDIIKWFEVLIDGEWKRCSDPRSGKIRLY